VWVTTAPKTGHELYAVCVDCRTGRILHTVKVFDVENPPPVIAVNTYASPSPAIEKGRVYVHFGSMGTACLDTGTGRILWQRRDLPCDHLRGPGSSLVLFGDTLIVTFDGTDVQYLVALDKKERRDGLEECSVHGIRDD
jgi:outer membrane protein assembly factor BamB